MKRKVPRFKKERTARISLLIGKIITAGIVSIPAYIIVLIVTGIEMTQETYLWYLSGIFAGLLAAKIKMHGNVDKKLNMSVMIMSLIMMVIAVNILANFEDKTLLSIMGLLAGMPTYTNIKYTFKNQEDDIKKHYDTNGYQLL